MPYLLYYRYDLHCGMSGDQSGQFSWLVLPLPLSQLCQTDHKKLFNKKLLPNLEYETKDNQTKDNFFTTTVINLFINNKTHCT